MADGGNSEHVGRADGSTEQTFPVGHPSYPKGAVVLTYPRGHQRYPAGAKVTRLPVGDPNHPEGAVVTEYPVGDATYPKGAVVATPLEEASPPSPTSSAPPATAAQRRASAGDPAARVASRSERLAAQRTQQQAAQRAAAAQAAAAKRAADDAKRVTAHELAVTAPDGSPLPVITAEQPFVVTAKLPAGSSNVPRTLDVIFTTKAGEKHLSVVLVRSGADGFIYRSEPLTLAHGGEGGDSISVLPGTPLRLEFPSGGVGSITTANGEDVKVSFTQYGDGASASFQAFATPDKATIFYGEAYIAAYDSLVRNTLIGLQHAPDSPAVRQLRAWAEGKFSILEGWHLVQEGKDWGDLERARYVAAYVSSLQGAKDPRDNAFRDDMERARREIHERYQGAFNVFLKEFVTSIYELYIGNLPLVAPLWTLITGTDIFGRQIEGWEYAMNVLDAAGQAAMLGLPFAIAHETAVPGTTRRPTAGIERPPVEGPITRAPAGTFIKNVNEIGLTVEQAKAFNRASSVAVAEEAERAAQSQSKLRLGGEQRATVEPRFREAHLQFRPMEAAVVDRVGEGCALKPEPVKAKTTSPVDVRGGWAKPGSENLVGYYPETLVGEKVGVDFTAIDNKTLEAWSQKAPPPPPGVAEDVWKRAIQRAKEFRDEAPAIAKYRDLGLLHVDENNLVVNDGICDHKLDPHSHEPVEIPGIKKGQGLGKHITGDPDGWAFYDEHGRPLPREVCLEIIERLHRAGVKHDLVTEWDIEHDPHYTPEEKTKNIGIRDKILSSHQGEPKPDGSFGPKGGATGVADFGGLTTPRAISYGGAPIEPQVPQRLGGGRRVSHVPGEWVKGMISGTWVFKPLTPPAPPPLDVRTPEDAADGIMEGLLQMGRVDQPTTPKTEPHEPTTEEKYDELRQRLTGKETKPDTRESSDEWEARHQAEQQATVAKGGTSTVKPDPDVPMPEGSKTETPHEGESSDEWEARHQAELEGSKTTQPVDKPPAAGLSALKKVVHAAITPIGVMLIIGGATLGTLVGVPVTTPAAQHATGVSEQRPADGGQFVSGGKVVPIPNAPVLVQGGFTNAAGGLTGAVTLSGDPHLWQEHQDAGKYIVHIAFDNGKRTVTITYGPNGGTTTVEHTGFTQAPQVATDGGTINVTAPGISAETFDVNVSTQLTYDVPMAQASLGEGSNGATTAPVSQGGAAGGSSGGDGSGILGGLIGTMVGVAAAIGVTDPPAALKRKKKDCSKQRKAYEAAKAKAQAAKSALAADQAADQKAIADAQKAVADAQQSVAWAQQLLNSFDSQGNWSPPNNDPANPTPRPTIDVGQVRFISRDKNQINQAGANADDVQTGSAGSRPLNANDAQNGLNQAQDALATAQSNLAAVTARSQAKEAADAQKLSSADASAAKALSALQACEAANS
jgi:hypothetical protein